MLNNIFESLDKYKGELVLNFEYTNKNYQIEIYKIRSSYYAILKNKHGKLAEGYEKADHWVMLNNDIENSVTYEGLNPIEAATTFLLNH